MPEIPAIIRMRLAESRIFPVASDTEDFEIVVGDGSDLSLISYARYLLGVHAPLRRVDDLSAYVPAASTDQHSIDKNRSSNSSFQSSTNVVDSRAVKTIDGLIRSAISERASDIHFETGREGLTCRVRVDGMLLERQFIETALVPEVLSRLKIMAGLDIAERRRPQDGRIRFEVGGRTVDIRVSVIPTEVGEKAVLRLLDKTQLRLDLSALGFAPNQLALFNEKIGVSNGIVLVTGPTGSGKTTTLYAALNQLRAPHLNISTVEDPIEYHLAGVNQTQVKPEIGLSFASMLRALLRQDPNIIMVGEIRDQETLEISLRAALTGHLVLSTVHTNGAAATVGRLIDMGAEPFLLGSTLRLIVAQRLVRLNCPHCRIPLRSSTEKQIADKLGLSLSGSECEATGCPSCAMTGYLGRNAIYELLSITDSVREAIEARAPSSMLLQAASVDGFTPLACAGAALITSGQTRPSEVFREINS